MGGRPGKICTALLAIMYSDLCLNYKGRFLICSKKGVDDVTTVLFGKTLLAGYCAVCRKRREMGAYTGLFLREWGWGPEGR